MGPYLGLRNESSDCKQRLFIKLVLVGLLLWLHSVYYCVLQAAVPEYAVLSAHQPASSSASTVPEAELVAVTAAAAIPESAVSMADEEKTISIITKYKELLDLGAITQEEYDAKKKKLLGL